MRTTIGHIFPGVFAERISQGDIIRVDAYRGKPVVYAGKYTRNEDRVNFAAREAEGPFEGLSLNICLKDDATIEVVPA